MKNFLILFILCLCIIPESKAMDPRLKVILTTGAYGTAGGALLGTAGLAFGADSKAIFQGASIGLYAGLIFGGYILWTHHQKRRWQGSDGQYPDDQASPYSDEGGAGSGDPYDYDNNFGAPQRVEWQIEVETPFTQKVSTKKVERDIPLFYFQLLQFNF